MRMIMRAVTTALALALATPVIAASADPLAPVASNIPPSPSFDANTIIVTSRGHSPASPDVFGTVALNAGVTVYGARWRRVSAADLHDPRLKTLLAGTAGLDPLAKLDMIQAAVHRRIKWRRDLDSYRVSDYWARAGETLDRGHGDAEDIAILKMQALKAAGFDARDLYLSVGRDSARGADTLLLVRVAGRFYALDDRVDRPLTADEYARFVPVITLGKDSAWLHGKRYVGRGRATTRGVEVASRQTIAR